MKRILQAIDNVATKPVAGANDMSKFLSIIDKNNVQILNEASPHKVAWPVQMAMQHYQETSATKPIARTNSLLSKYVEIAEQLVSEEEAVKEQRIRQYSQKIANKVLMNESGRHRDAYQRDYDSSIRGMGTDDDWKSRERNAGLEHEQNNIAVHINGKLWKVLPGKGYADSHEEWQYMQNMRKWAEKKSASTGKKWSVHLTGASPTNESVSEAPIAYGSDDDIHNPVVHSHKKANPHNLQTIIDMATADLVRLANEAKSASESSFEHKLMVWQRLTKEFQTEGNLFQTLAGRAEQIRHGIEEIVQSRKTGKGVSPEQRGAISKNLEGLGSELSIKEANAKKRTLKFKPMLERLSSSGD